MQPVHTIQNIISITAAAQRQIISLCVISFSIKFYSVILLTERQTLDWDGHSSAKIAAKTVESRSMTVIRSVSIVSSFSLNSPSRNHFVFWLWTKNQCLCLLLFNFIGDKIRSIDGFPFHSHFECAVHTTQSYEFYSFVLGSTWKIIIRVLIWKMIHKRVRTENLHFDSEFVR